MAVLFNGRTATLCDVRKKSVEIPEKNLLSGVVFLSGGRDVRGGPVLSVVCPPSTTEEQLIEINERDFINLISYFTYVPSEEVRSRKFSVAFAVDSFHDTMLMTAIRGLNSHHQNNPEIIHMVYFIGSNRNTSADLVEWAYITDYNTDDPAIKPPNCIPHVVMSTMSELYQYISVDELTHEFGGTLQYKHQDWVRFRMQVEPFICDVMSVSKQLAESVAQFSEEHLPETVTEAEKSLKVHRLKRQDTLNSLQVEELTTENERIRQEMNSPSQQQFRNNPDFVATLDTIEVLMSRVENVRTRLENLWDSRHTKLQANLKHKKFETEAHQVIDWFEQYAEEFFETHNDIGDSEQIDLAMVSELENFESATKQILTKTYQLLNARQEVDGDEADFTGLTSKIRSLSEDFTSRLNARKKILNDNLKLHEIMHKAIDWCIEGFSFLADFDLMSQKIEDINPTEWKEKLLNFEELYPLPTTEEIALMNETTCEREGIQFALNRILELQERFELYRHMLDEMIEKKQRGPSPELVSGRDSTHILQNGHPPIEVNKADISAPLNPKFADDKSEAVSLDDTKFEESEEDDMAAQTAIAKHRRSLMKELLETEEQYIKDLEHICTHYMASMDDASKLPKCLVGKRNVLFGYLPGIVLFNREIILPRLRTCSKAPMKLGLVFLDNEEEFCEYSRYFKNRPDQAQLLKIDEAAHFFRSIQMSIKDSFPLLDHLNKPVQRVTKYRQFIEQMIKYSTKGKDQQAGPMVDYIDKLREALKVVDFVLRHGNDLLALESLKGYEGSLAEQGRVLRVGVLTVVDGFSKHRRKAFLFEHCLILAKITTTTKTGPSGAEEYEFKKFYRTNALILRENIPGHESRFALEMKKTTIDLQAESVEVKKDWVTDIWDLLFTHMLKLRDDKLISYGTNAISTPITSVAKRVITRSHSATNIASTRKRRLSTISDTRWNREARAHLHRPSITSVGSSESLKDLAVQAPLQPSGLMGSSISASSTSNSISAGFTDGRDHSTVAKTQYDAATAPADYSSQISTCSSSFDDVPMYNTPL